ncbi:hypothetical protein ACH5RR_032222, partial [Cinchona calisaya]
AVLAMSKVCPLLTIGPTIPSFYLDNRVENDKDYGLNLFDLEPSISINWLHNKPKGSVIYVAFGSMVNFEENQMEELAWGLKESNFYFLWVVSACEEAKLPKDFVQKTSQKGLLVRWSPQLEVLSNEAIGCFFSHCGWNSSIEALSLGVPMVVMPQWTDQTTNAKLVQDVLKAGVRVKVDENGLVGREEIEGCLREVMEGERGKLMKSNAIKWRNLAKEAYPVIIEALDHAGCVIILDFFSQKSPYMTPPFGLSYCCGSDPKGICADHVNDMAVLWAVAGSLPTSELAEQFILANEKTCPPTREMVIRALACVETNDEVDNVKGQLAAIKGMLKEAFRHMSF